jgi:integrase
MFLDCESSHWLSYVCPFDSSEGLIWTKPKTEMPAPSTSIPMHWAAIKSVLHPKKSGRIVSSHVRIARVYSRRKQERFDNRSCFRGRSQIGRDPQNHPARPRHTFCSWLAMAGATTREIMEAAGRKTMSQAARYSHLSPQHTQSVVDWISIGTGHAPKNQHAPEHAPGSSAVFPLQAASQ